MGEMKYNGRSYSGLIQANGCFIDTDNVIASGSYIGNFSYTATQDCCVYTAMAMGNNTGCTMKIDGNDVAGGWNGVGTVISQGLPIFLKKGQTLTISSTYSATTSYFVYGIQQGSNITFLSEYASACYDTNEREVGCWVDGKPVYQRTVEISNVSYDSNWHNVAHGISNVESIVQIKGIMKTTSNYFYNCDVFRPSTTLGVVMEVTATNISYINSWIDNADKLYVTLAYTKTTDTAGSGQFAPTGIPTHHYSTNEQVVGTWVDGKTVYETSFPITSALTFTSNSWVDMGISQGDMYKIIDGKVIMDYQGEYSYQNLQFGWINNKLVGNSFRNFEIEPNHGHVVLQYTKSTD